MVSGRYRPDIDGLRAWAVIPVVLFHCDEHLMPGGFLGVDVFFVISGFLITSIMLRELAAGTFSLRRFWIRRIQRIVPNLLCVSAVTLAVAWMWLFKGDHMAVGSQIIAALFSFANVYFWQVAGNYWGPDAHRAPFLHTWSLSLEEQFYFLLPVMVRFLHRRASSSLPWVLLGLLMSSYFLYRFGAAHHPVATFYLLPTRAWELLSGSLLASLTFVSGDKSLRPHLRDALSILGLGMIVSAYAISSDMFRSPVAAVLGTCLVISMEGGWAANAMLNNPLAVGIGKVSYSLYLWHWPVLVLGEEVGFLGPKWVLVLIAFGISIVNYVVLETPARYMNNALPRIGAAFAATAACAALMATVPTFYDTGHFGPSESYCLYFDTGPRADPDTPTPSAFHGLRAPRRHSFSPTDYLDGGVRTGEPDSAPAVVLLGDSQGSGWSHTVESIVNERGLPCAFWSVNGVTPFMPIPTPPGLNRRNAVLSDSQQRRYDQARLAMIQSWHPQVVIVAAMWSQAKEQFARDTVNFLCQHANHVVLIEQPPEAGLTGRNMMQYLCYLGLDASISDKDELTVPQHNAASYEVGRTLMRRLAAEQTNCTCVPVADVFLRHDGVVVVQGGELLYVDATHLTEAGARRCQERLTNALNSALVDSSGSFE